MATERIEPLISAAEIDARVDELAREINDRYEGREIAVVGVLTGAVFFLVDLVRRLDSASRVTFFTARSYRAGRSAGPLEVEAEDPGILRGRDVLVVDDVLDTGATLGRVLDMAAGAGPASLASCVLLVKDRQRVRAIEPDFVGFRIDDVYVVGYGLDLAGRHRTLPYVGKVVD